ncbi:hypothetical protein BDF22DRAFT_746226 [Syncephalis plumigaleata]|nr:hypothetical protein BDF22DRAFT_746226 [Syncephalis plumigaleata]
MEHDTNSNNTRSRYRQNTSRARYRQRDNRGRHASNVERQGQQGQHSTVRSRRGRHEHGHGHGRGCSPQTSARRNTSMATSTSTTHETSSSISILATSDAATPSIMPNIPGYYYDTERKRYFRIVNAQASGGQMPSSYETMRKKQRLELESRQLQMEQQQHQTEWKRYRNLHDILWRRERHTSRIMNRYSHCVFIIMSSHGDFILTGNKKGALELHHLAMNDTRQQMTITLSTALAYVNSQITSVSLWKNKYYVTTHLGDGALLGGVEMGCINLDDQQNDAYSIRFRSSGSPWCSDINDSYAVAGGNNAVYINSLDGAYSSRISIRSDALAISIAPGSPSLIRIGCRNVSPVLEFAGHVNEYTQSLGMATDSTGTVLAAAGQDKRIRFWSTLTGEQLRHSSDPLPQTIPALQWHGPTSPGVLQPAMMDTTSSGKVPPSLWAVSGSSLCASRLFI